MYKYILLYFEYHIPFKKKVFINMKNNLKGEILKIKSMMFLNENVEEFSFERTNQDLQDLGVPPISDEEAEALMGCPEDDVPPQFINTYKRISDQISKISDRTVLKDLFKKIKSLMKGTKVQKEQLEAAPVMILGVPLGTAALIAIGTLLLIKIVTQLLKRKDRAYKPSCRAGASDMRREFGRKL